MSFKGVMSSWFHRISIPMRNYLQIGFFKGSQATQIEWKRQTMNRRQNIIFWLVFWCLQIPPVFSYAGETTLQPNLSVSARYDNNILFDRVDAIEDYSSIIRPSLSLIHKTERNTLNLDADVKFVNYLEETDLDNTKQKYAFSIDSELTERLSSQAGVRYILDTLLDSELEETGITYNQEDRQRINAHGGLNFSLSPKASMGAFYDFAQTDYEESTRADRNKHTVWITFSRLFNEGMDSLSVVPKYRHILVSEYVGSDPDVTIDGKEAHNFSLNLGWTHKSSEVGTIRLFLGGQYTEEIPDNGGDKRETEGVVADLSYTIKDEISNLRMGYRRDISYDADNDLREVDRLYVLFDYSLTERSQAGIYVNGYLTRTENQNSADNDTRFLDIQTKIAYSLTERHSMELIYRFSQEYDDAQEDKTVGRSQILLAVVLRFPTKF